MKARVNVTHREKGTCKGPVAGNLRRSPVKLGRGGQGLQWEQLGDTGRSHAEEVGLDSEGDEQLLKCSDGQTRVETRPRTLLRSQSLQRHAGCARGPEKFPVCLLLQGNLRECGPLFLGTPCRRAVPSAAFLSPHPSHSGQP